MSVTSDSLKGSDFSVFLVGVGGFAAMVPELATLLSSGSKYGGRYKVRNLCRCHSSSSSGSAGGSTGGSVI